jgi:hypothetical protein
MKAIRVLFAVSVFAVFAGLAAAADAPAKQEQCDKAKETCPKDCDKPCCKQECCAADQAKCDKSKEMPACCAEAAKNGKVCEKCNPPAKK